jgi:hypothetical protein
MNIASDSRTTNPPPLTPYPFHSLANKFPLLNGSEFLEFVADIEAQGLREPITLYEGQVLDGRNRYRACLRLKREPRFKEFKGDAAAACAFVISQNIVRRHLKAKEKLEALAALIKANPEKSDRAIAADLKVDKNVVSRARKKVEETGAPAPVEKRTGKDGKSRRLPTKKTRPAKPETSKTIAPAAASQTMPGDIGPVVEFPKPVETTPAPAVSDELIITLRRLNGALNSEIEDLREARTKLESEIEKLTAENAKLREELAAARAADRITKTPLMEKAS